MIHLLWGTLDTTLLHWLGRSWTWSQLTHVPQDPMITMVSSYVTPLKWFNALTFPLRRDVTVIPPSFGSTYKFTPNSSPLLTKESGEPKFLFMAFILPSELLTCYSKHDNPFCVLFQAWQPTFLLSTPTLAIIQFWRSFNSDSLSIGLLMFHFLVLFYAIILNMRICTTSLFSLLQTNITAINQHWQN